MGFLQFDIWSPLLMWYAAVSVRIHIGSGVTSQSFQEYIQIFDIIPTKTYLAYLVLHINRTGGPLLVRSPLVRFPLVRILLLQV